MIPILPNDLMFMIFDELTSEERAPIGITCKRFRELDFELGKKTFDKIAVECGSAEYSVIGESSSCLYNIRGDSTNFIQPTNHNLRLFRRSSTKLLKIIHGPNNCDHAQSLTMLSLIETVSNKIIVINFHCDKDCSEKLIPVLMSNRDLSKTCVIISWFSQHLPCNVPRRRELMMQLPKMDQLMIDNMSYHLKTQNGQITPDNECIIDDAILLHLTAVVRHSDLSVGHFSAKGLLSAFEIVCKAPLSKSVAVRLPQTVVEELFKTADARLKRSPSNRCLSDAASKSYMRVCEDSPPIPNSSTRYLVMCNFPFV